MRKTKQKQKRLSIKLLWKLLNKWEPPHGEPTNVGIFIDFVEQHIKTVSERHQTPTTTKPKRSH